MYVLKFQEKQNMDTQVPLPAALGLLCESEYCEHLQAEPVKEKNELNLILKYLWRVWTAGSESYLMPMPRGMHDLCGYFYFILFNPFTAKDKFH